MRPGAEDAGAVRRWGSWAGDGREAGPESDSVPRRGRRSENLRRRRRVESVIIRCIISWAEDHNRLAVPPGTITLRRRAAAGVVAVEMKGVTGARKT